MASGQIRQRRHPRQPRWTRGYWSGAALGAITIPEPLARNLLVLSVSWAAVVPLLLLPGAAIRRRTNRRSQVLGLPEKYCATHYLRPCLNP